MRRMLGQTGSAGQRYIPVERAECDPYPGELWDEAEEDWEDEETRRVGPGDVPHPTTYAREG